MYNLTEVAWEQQREFESQCKRRFHQQALGGSSRTLTNTFLEHLHRYP